MEWLVIIMYVVLGLMPSHKADSAEFNRTSLSYLAGDGYVTGEQQRNIISFDAIRKTERTLLYANVDLQSFTDKASSPVSRIVFHIGDKWHLAGQVQNGAGYSNTNVGVGYSCFFDKGFAGIDAYRRADSLMGDGSYVFMFGRHDFDSDFTVSGFIDLSLPDKGQQQALAQPSLMYRFDKNLSAGIEYQIYLNKGYISKKDEVVPQLKITYGW